MKRKAKIPKCEIELSPATGSLLLDAKRCAHVRTVNGITVRCALPPHPAKTDCYFFTGACPTCGGEPRQPCPRRWLDMLTWKPCALDRNHEGACRG